MNEKWKDILGFEGLYQASNKGRIKSLARSTKRYNTLIQRYTSTNQKERLMKLYLNKNGHIYVNLSKYGVTYTQQVGYFILLAFKGEKPKGFNIECSHKDGNALNNNKDNLLWESSSNNNLRKRDHGTILIGSKNGNAKLNDIKVTEIKQHIVNGLSQRKIANMYDVTQSCIMKINTNKTWAHIKWPKGKI